MHRCTCGYEAETEEKLDDHITYMACVANYKDADAPHRPR